MAFVRCSKRRGGTPTGERPRWGAPAPMCGPLRTRLSAFRLPAFFFLSFGSEQRGRKSRTPPPALLRDRSESRHFVLLAVPLPQTSDADRIARTMALASLRGAKRRSNPDQAAALDCFASLAMTGADLIRSKCAVLWHPKGRTEKCSPRNAQPSISRATSATSTPRRIARCRCGRRRRPRRGGTQRPAVADR